MNKEMLFRDFEGLSHHYKFIDTLLEKTIGKFEGFRPIHARVTIDAIARKTFKGHEFGCEIIVQHPDMRKTILTHKFSKDFYQSVRAACAAAETVLRRHSKNRLSQRRKAHSEVNLYQPSTQQI